MRLVKLGTRHNVVLMGSGAQILCESEVPIAMKSPAGVWYVNEDVFRQDSLALIKRYIGLAKESDVHNLPANVLAYRVEQL